MNRPHNGFVIFTSVPFQLIVIDRRCTTNELLYALRGFSKSTKSFTLPLYQFTTHTWLHHNFKIKIVKLDFLQ